MNAAARIAVAAALCAGLVPAHAALYRCPAAEDDEQVVTNLMREADAKERGCEPLQARRSTLDAPPRASLARAPAAQPRAGERPADARPPGREAVPAGRPVERGESPERFVPKEVQRARDSDARTILAAELGREEQKADELARRLRGLAPASAERITLAAALTRHQADAESIKREIARLR